MLTYKSMLSAWNLQQHCKEILNTNGNGWRQSTFKFLKMNYKIEPINIHIDLFKSNSSSVFKDPCESFLLISDEDYIDHELIVSLPKIDIEENGDIIHVWLPFKRKRNFILNSQSSAFVLTRYYVDVLKCYEFRNAASKEFDRGFQKLLYEKILPFVHTDEFYPGFGAILRVWEALKRKDLVVRRSAFKYDDQDYADEYLTKSVNSSNKTDQINDQINKIEEEQAINKTNFIWNAMDSMKEFENQWNRQQKAKFICLALIGATIGLLLICLCIFLRRDRRLKKISASNETRERRKNLKVLLKNMKTQPEKKSYENDVEIDPSSHLGQMIYNTSNVTMQFLVSDR